MKKIFLPLLGIALAFSFTGKKDLPGNIATTLNAKYPGAKIKGWEMVKDEYKVKFTEDRNKDISYFATDGKWLRTEKHIGLTKDLPAVVKQGFEKSHFAAWHIDNIKELTVPGQPNYYVLHVDDGNELDSWHYDAFKSDRLLIFDREGHLERTENPSPKG